MELIRIQATAPTRQATPVVAALACLGCIREAMSETMGLYCNVTDLRVMYGEGRGKNATGETTTTAIGCASSSGSQMTRYGLGGGGGEYLSCPSSITALANDILYRTRVQRLVVITTTLFFFFFFMSVAVKNVKKKQHTHRRDLRSAMTARNDWMENKKHRF